MNKLISVVVPAFNEDINIPLAYKEIKEIFAELPNFNWELIFVDDGSSDDTENVLEQLSKADENVKFIQFSRNFGKEIATSAGIEAAKGDAVLMIDADLQHPVDLIPEFIGAWQGGVDVVVGVRAMNKNEGLVKKLGSFLFYKIMNLIGETEITPRATDYRLIDRKVANEFCRFTERGRMTRGLIDWLGFKRSYIVFNANEREHGQAGYNPVKLFRLALNSFIAHSLFPLRFAGYLGISIMILFGSFGLYVFIGKYLTHDSFASSFSGPAQLAMLLIFFVGVILSCLGLVALYIATIQAEVSNRPLYVVRKSSFCHPEAKPKDLLSTNDNT